MATYRFLLESFEILNTRSLLKDTNTVGFSIAVGQGEPQVQTMFMGDVDNGLHNVNLVFENIQLSDTDIVTLSYHITNKGGDPAEAANYVKNSLHELVNLATSKIGTVATAAIGSAIGGAIGSAVPLVGTAIGALAGWLTGSAWDIIFANCDGPVGAAIHIFTGAELQAMLTNGPSVLREHHPGVDSSAGCGANSNYFTTLSMTWTDKPITDPNDELITSVQATISTGDIDSAGTDANVTLSIDGVQYDLHDSSINNFERGVTTSYLLPANLSLRQLKHAQINLSHDNSGDKPGWYVSNFSLLFQLQHGSELNLYRTWPNVGWLSVDDGGTFVELQHRG